jgi:hypothetical protein
MDRTLTAFLWVWVALLIGVNLIGIAGFFVGADSAREGLQKVGETVRSI